MASPRQKLATRHRATEIRLLAERQMGEFLKVMPKNRGGDPVNDKYRVGQPPTLKDLGVGRIESSRAQKLADIPKEEFVERIEAIKANGERRLHAVTTPIQIPPSPML